MNTDHAAEHPRGASAGPIRHALGSAIGSILGRTELAISRLRRRPHCSARRYGSIRTLDRLARRVRTRLAPPRQLAGQGRLYPATHEMSDRPWIYHDERWRRIIDRWEHRRMLKEGRQPVVEDEQQQPDGQSVRLELTSLDASVSINGPERWIYAYLHPQQHDWRNFRWTFRVTRRSAFRELQFGFRYVDFYNRYRFRHQENRFYFDIAHNGEFCNDLARCDFEMRPDRSYDVAIEARGNRLLLWVDDQLLLDEVDPSGLFPRGSIAIILWENDGQTPIDVAINNIEVVQL